MLNRLNAVQECDATDDASSNNAGKIIVLTIVSQ